MKDRRVVISGATFPAEVVDRLTGNGLTVETIPGDWDKSGVLSALDGAWGYVLGGSERMTKEVWQAVPDLAVACFLGTGYQTYMQLPDTPSKTVFTYTPHANAQAVAEFTVALMLDLTRHVTERANLVRDGGWTEEATSSLFGARVGIVGMGHIGQEVARIVSTAFGSQVSYWNRSPKPELETLGYRRVETIEQLCREADVLSLNTAYSPGQTDGLIGKRELAALRPSGLLVNTARAELVEPSALREALASGQLAGAAMDGYYEEPTPAPENDTHGLIEFAPRMLITPHCAYLSRQAMLRMAEMAAENLIAVAEQRSAPFQV
jgi:phosphoglycerate dehydrogenase-like enzyme